MRTTTEEYAVPIEAVGTPLPGRPGAGTIDDAIRRIWEAARYGEVRTKASL